MTKSVFVIGSFVADVAFRLPRLPVWGETLMGDSFVLGPGGKGSNQAVAAARAGASVQLLSRVGQDAFGTLARETWQASGIDASLVSTSDTPTGAAAILIDAANGENAIVIVPGACFTLTPADVETAASVIASAAALLTQFELPLPTVQRGLELARARGVPTILNPAPAPAESLPDTFFRLADFLIPNESEAALLTGRPPDALASGDKAAAERTADDLLARGAGQILLTLGSRGSLLRTHDRRSTWIPSYHAGSPINTAGAGDAFCGAFAAALVRGDSVEESAHFASAAAGIAVTRQGTAASMPSLQEIRTLLRA